jgi:hypothetical protein
MTDDTQGTLAPLPNILADCCLSEVELHCATLTLNGVELRLRVGLKPPYRQFLVAFESVQAFKVLNDSVSHKVESEPSLLEPKLMWTLVESPWVRELGLVENSYLGAHTHYIVNTYEYRIDVVAFGAPSISEIESLASLEFL